MSWQWWTLLRRTFRLRPREDRDLDDELAFHLAEETRLRLERGAPPEDAARQARVAFGNVTLTKETVRGVWVSGAIERLLQDIRFGARIVTNAPALLLTAVILVALVVGGNTTVFSIAHAILTKPAPGVRASDLVTVTWIRNSGSPSVLGSLVEPETSYANYVDLAAQSRLLRPMLAYQYVRAALGHDNGSHGIWIAAVSANYFQTLDVPVPLGRDFTADDNDTAPSGLVVVISDRAWRDYFASSAGIVGAAVLVNGLPATVIGVAAPDFRGTLLAPSVDAWVPVVPFARALGENALSNGAGAAGGRGPFVGVAMGIHARLPDHSSVREAQAELTTIWSRLQAVHADAQDRSVTIVPYAATAGGDGLISTQGNTFLAIFSVITMLTLVIVCANVANLLLGRTTMRQRELALRQSLGASRVRIVRMLLAEGLVIALLACVTAYACARWMVSAVAGVMGPIVPPAILDMITAPDWTVVAYAMALAFGSMLIFTLAPAMRAWRQSLLPWLKAGEQGVVQSRSRLSSGLVVLQLAFAVLLITSAGLASRSIFLLAGADLGFDSRRVLLATVNTAGSAVDRQTNAVLLERLRERLQAVPGIERVSYAGSAPRELPGLVPLRSNAASDPVLAEHSYVGPEFLAVHGLTPVSGRELGVESGRTTTPVVVTQQLAETLWPGQSAIGRRILLGGGQRQEEAEIVGVSPDALFDGNRPTRRPFVLRPASADQSDPGERALYLRYRGSLDDIARAVTRAIRIEDPRVPLVSLRTLDAHLETNVWWIRALTTLLTMFAVGSLVIASIGQYAVVAFDMRRRVRELGVRIALGASSRQILTSVLREGFRLTAIGLTIGFGLSAVIGTGLSRVLYGITPTDPLTYGSVLLLLSLVSAIACFLPALRASRVNPIATLRQE